MSNQLKTLSFQFFVIDCLDLSELNNCLSEVMESDISLKLTKMVCDEFDKDATDTIDIAEFSMMMVRTNESDICVKLYSATI